MTWQCATRVANALTRLATAALSPVSVHYQHSLMNDVLSVRLHRELKVVDDVDVAMTQPLVVDVAESDAAQLSALSRALFSHRRVDCVDDGDDDGDDRAVYCVASTTQERLRLIAELDALTSKCAFFEKKKKKKKKKKKSIFNNQFLFMFIFSLFTFYLNV
jgi:hypothetical protein